MSTMSMAARMMPLNSVNTFARMMSTREREVDDLTALACPPSFRALTSVAVRPDSPIGGMEGLALMLVSLPSPTYPCRTFL